MAKKKRPVKRKSASLKGRARGATGRLLDYEQAQRARLEVIARLEDAVFMPQELKEAKIKRAFRWREIEREQKERRQRFGEKPKAYKWAPKANNEYAIHASRLAARGILPTPTEVIRYEDGEVEYVWAFQGPHGLDAINNMLVHAKGSFPKDAAGYISQGTGYGRDAQWGGTAFSPVHSTDVAEKNLWLQLQTFQLSTTDTLKHLREHFGQKQENGRFPTQWVELKILSTEGLKYENVTEDGSTSNAREVDGGSKSASASGNRNRASGKRGKSRHSAGKKVSRRAGKSRNRKKLPR